MARLTLYGLKTCDTCRKARAALEAAGHALAVVEIREEADLAAKVPDWLAAVGAGSLLNRRSTSWRSLEESERARAEDGSEDGEVAALLIAHPTLIKRPVIETEDGAVHVGWTRPVQAALLG